MTEKLTSREHGVPDWLTQATIQLVLTSNWSLEWSTERCGASFKVTGLRSVLPLFREITLLTVGGVCVHVSACECVFALCPGFYPIHRGGLRVENGGPGNIFPAVILHRAIGRLCGHHFQFSDPWNNDSILILNRCSVSFRTGSVSWEGKRLLRGKRRFQMWMFLSPGSWVSVNK